MDLNPKHETLEDSATIIKEIESVKASILNKSHVPHELLLKQLLKQIKPIDFKGIAFPQIASLRKQIEKEIKDRSLSKEEEESDPELLRLKKQIEGYKLNQKHFLIITIDEVLKIAAENNWGLCKKDGCIYLYNGAFWLEVEKDIMEIFLVSVAKKLGVHIYTAKYHKFKDELYKQFLAQTGLGNTSNDPNKVCINLQNGTFEISPKKQFLRIFAPEDFLCYQLSFSYEPLAQAPEFQRYLDGVLPVKEKQMILAEYLGYVFIRNSSDYLKIEQVLFLYGGGANGKSVFFDIVSALLGKENVSNYTLTSLTDEKGYHRARIGNKLLNYSSEISTKLNVNTFKELASGEPVEARIPYQLPFNMKEYAKLIFNCNELPKDIEHTNAFFRRLLIIHFNVTIEKEKQDNTLAQRIIENELPGVFNWVLDGLSRVIKNRKFTYSKDVDKELNDYKKESDTAALFLEEESLKASPKYKILIKELYLKYRAFCYEGGYRELQKQNFIKRLKHLSILVKREKEGNVAYLENVKQD